MRSATFTDDTMTTIALDTGDGIYFVPAVPGNRFYAEILASGVTIAAAPTLDAAEILTATRAGTSLSRRQVIIGMVVGGLITQAEGMAMAATGTPPAAVESMLAAMPEPDQTAARITLASFSVAERLDPMVALFQQAGNLTDAQTDAFFAACSDI